MSRRERRRLRCQCNEHEAMIRRLVTKLLFSDEDQVDPELLAIFKDTRIAVHRDGDDMRVDMLR